MEDIAETRCAELAGAYIVAWKAFDLNAIMELHTADSVFHLHATGQSPAVGSAAVRAAFEASMAAFSDIQVEVGRLTVGEDFWVTELTMRGKFGGKTAVEMPGVDIVSVRDGLVARKDSYFDSGPVMALLAAGQKSPMSQDDIGAVAMIDFFQRGWALSKPDGFMRHFYPWIHPNIVATQPMMPIVRGRAAFEQMFIRVFTLLPDMNLSVIDWAARGEWIFIRSRCQCTLGFRKLVFEACDALRLSNGMMIERHAYFDPSPLSRAILTQPWLWPRAIARRKANAKRALGADVP